MKPTYWYLYDLKMIKNKVITSQDERQGEAVSEDSLPVVNEAVLDLHDQALVKINM